MQTNGDDLKIQPATIDTVVEPEQEYTWTLAGMAPEKPGRYSAYFRMVTGNNYRFGHKVWVDILVEEQKEVPDEMLYDEEPAKVEEPKDILATSNMDIGYPDLSDSVHDKSGGENIQSSPCTVEDLMKSVSRTPK